MVMEEEEVVKMLLFVEVLEDQGEYCSELNGNYFLCHSFK